METETDWQQLEFLLNQKLNPEKRNNTGIIHKICHHVPTQGYPDHQKPRGLEKIRRDICLKAYEDRETPGIYVGGVETWEDILRDHPEIRYFAYVGHEINERDLGIIQKIRGDNPLTARGFEISDWDRRAASTDNHPSEENVRPVVDYLQEWYDAGTPPCLIRCAQGLYRSGVTVLAAHSMITGDPRVSATRLVLADWGTIDSNWEIARIADPMLGFDGQLHSTAVNVQRAVGELGEMLMNNSSLEEVVDSIITIFHNPWDEEKAAYEVSFEKLLDQHKQSQ